MLRVLINLVKDYPGILGYNFLISKMIKRYQEGQINIEEAKFLQRLVRQAPTDRPIIEIGTLFGTSTK